MGMFYTAKNSEMQPQMFCQRRKKIREKQIFDVDMMVIGKTEQVWKMNSPVHSRALLEEIWVFCPQRWCPSLSCSYSMQLLCNPLCQLLGGRCSKGRQERKKGEMYLVCIRVMSNWLLVESVERAKRYLQFHRQLLHQLSAKFCRNEVTFFIVLVLLCL